MEPEFINFKVSRQLKAKLLKLVRKEKGTLSDYMRHLVCKHVKAPAKYAEMTQGRPVTKGK